MGELSGYPIPDNITTTDTRCVIVTIPDDDGYHRALIGQITMLGKWWKWKRTNSEDAHAKITAETYRQLVKFTYPWENTECEEGEEPLTLTLEEMIQAICEGMECHVDELARRWLLASSAENIRNGASISPDQAGIVISTAFETPDDLTENQQEARNGGMYAVAVQFSKLLDKTSTYIDNTYSQSLIAQLINVFIGSPVGEITGLDTLIADYILDYATEQITVSDIVELTEYLYCEGIQDGFISYLENITVTETQLDYYLRFFSLIPPSTLNRWYESGIATPRSDYFNFGCFNRAPFQFTITPTPASQVSSIPSWTVSRERLLRVKLSGVITNDAGDEYDGIYIKTASTGQITQSFMGLNLTGGGSVATDTRPSTNIPYNDIGYAYVVILNDFGGAYNTATRVLPGPVFNWTGKSGSITLQYTDLGEVDS